MGIVANPRSYDKPKQVQFYACRILCKITVRHNDEESGDQYAMDNACFAWSVVAALYLAERNSERESLYPYYATVLNLQDIQFPITPKNIIKFERFNKVSMNVYIPSKNRKFSRYGSLMTSRRSTSICYTCKIHETTWAISRG